MLGAIVITRGVAPASKIEAINTQTLRITVFKDQWPYAWDDFLHQPMRELLKAVPTLCLCKTPGCGVSCGKYHHEDLDEPLGNLILDLWSRSWHRSDGKFTKPGDAASWSALIRVPASAQLVLQGLSGQAGLFVEPRSDTGKETDPAYGIVWLGNISLQDAHHKLKVTANAIALARVQNKYGLRLPADHLEAAHKQHHPEEVYAGTKVQEIFRLYPVPWGTQRAALQKCLNEWGWKAKVLQTTGGGSEGSAWEVGAAAHPPSAVLQDKAGDIVITHVRSSAKDPKPAPVLASVSTKQHIKTGSKTTATSSSDPWLSGPDPWGGYNGLAPSITKVPVNEADAADRFKQMENRLSTNLQEQIHAALEKSQPSVPQDMEIQDDGVQTANEERFQRLEAGMTELQAQGVKFEGWFTQMHQTEQFLGAQIRETNERLDAASTTVNDQIGALQNNIQNIHGEVTSGFAHMEALLSKSRRTEWLGLAGLSLRRVPAMGIRILVLLCLQLTFGEALHIHLATVPKTSKLTQQDLLSQRHFACFTDTFEHVEPGDVTSYPLDFARYFQLSAAHHSQRWDCNFGSGPWWDDDCDLPFAWAWQGDPGHSDDGCVSLMAAPRFPFRVDQFCEVKQFPWGEASNPGPPLHISFGNPSGLRGKEAVLYMVCHAAFRIWGKHTWLVVVNKLHVGFFAIGLGWINDVCIYFPGLMFPCEVAAEPLAFGPECGNLRMYPGWGSIYLGLKMNSDLAELSPQPSKSAPTVCLAWCSMLGQPAHHGPRLRRPIALCFVFSRRKWSMEALAAATFVATSMVPMMTMRILLFGKPKDGVKSKSYMHSDLNSLSSRPARERLDPTASTSHQS